MNKTLHQLDIFKPFRMQDGSKVLIGVLVTTAAAVGLWAYISSKKHRSSKPELKIEHCRAAYRNSNGCPEGGTHLIDLTATIKYINMIIKAEPATLSRVQLPIEVQRERADTCHQLWGQPFVVRTRIGKKNPTVDSITRDFVGRADANRLSIFRW